MAKIVSDSLVIKISKKGKEKIIDLGKLFNDTSRYARDGICRRNYRTLEKFSNRTRISRKIANHQFS